MDTQILVVFGEKAYSVRKVAQNILNSTYTYICNNYVKHINKTFTYITIITLRIINELTTLINLYK